MINLYDHGPAWFFFWLLLKQKRSLRQYKHIINIEVVIRNKYIKKESGRTEKVKKNLSVWLMFICSLRFLDWLTWRLTWSFLSFSRGDDISLQRLNSHVHSLIVQRRMTLRMGIKEEEITFIKKFRFPPSFWSCARRTFMLMKCINKVLKLSRLSLAHVSELENFQTRQLQSEWVPLKRCDLGDGLPLV